MDWQPPDGRHELSGALRRGLARRRLLRTAAAGTLVLIGGSLYSCGPREAEQAAAESPRPDGRPRLPPNQRLLTWLKPMGGTPGDPSPAGFRLKVYGEVEKPLELDFAGLLKLPQVEQKADVHCVTGWSCLDVECKGVQVSHLAELAGVKKTAKHVIFEAAADYSTNVPLAEALAPNVLVAHRLRGDPVAEENGAPVRGIVPDLYFWKSAKWLTGIRFVTEDEPGFWEVRGYHNHADPWKEERYG